MKSHILAGRAVQTVVDARLPEISITWNPSKGSIIRYLPTCISPDTKTTTFVLGTQATRATICKNKTGPTINHAIVIVGYGEWVFEGKPQKYFIMQNSYGGLWGFNGICRIDYILNAGLGSLGGFAYELKKKK